MIVQCRLQTALLHEVHGHKSRVHQEASMCPWRRSCLARSSHDKPASAALQGTASRPWMCHWQDHTAASRNSAQPPPQTLLENSLSILSPHLENDYQNNSMTILLSNRQRARSETRLILMEKNTCFWQRSLTATQLLHGAKGRKTANTHPESAFWVGPHWAHLSAPNHKSQIASDLKSRSPNRKNFPQIAVSGSSNRTFKSRDLWFEPLFRSLLESQCQFLIQQVWTMNELFWESSHCLKSLVICDSRFESQIAIAVKSRDLELLGWACPCSLILICKCKGLLPELLQQPRDEFHSNLFRQEPPFRNPARAPLLGVGLEDPCQTPR